MQRDTKDHKEMQNYYKESQRIAETQNDHKEMKNNYKETQNDHQRYKMTPETQNKCQ